MSNNSNSNSKFTVLSSLSELAARVKNHITKSVAEVAGLAVDAIAEMAETKADKLSAAAVSIPATGWSSDSMTGYPFYYSLAVSGLTTMDRADVLIAPASLGTAAQCGLCLVTETGAGYVRLRAVSVPSAGIAAEIQIMKGGN